MEPRDAPKLRKVRRLDSTTLDSTYFTNEGYLVDHPILTSTGIFEYINPDGSVRRELRLPEHVFNEKSLKSYRGKPVIITHDAGVVDKNNVDKEQIGTILSDGYQDGDDVRAEIIIHDTDAMKESGLKELSLGYNLDLIEEPGVWKGEPYDAIQTNIVINHLALVASARAGEQARLNIDGSDEPTLKGGKVMAKVKRTRRTDSGAMSPEELQKAIGAYKARKAERASAGKKEASPVEDGDVKPVAPPAPAVKKEPEGNGPAGKTPQDIAEMVKARRGRRDSENDPEDTESAMGVIAQQDEDIDMLLACLEKFFAEEKAEGNHDGDEEECDGDDGKKDCGNTDEGDDPEEKEPQEEEENEDSSDDKSQSLNADSADELFRQRLSICRIGDKLHLDGLENKSIIAGKKEIIAKVLPTMNLDGKSRVYIDAAYDLAVGEVNKRKDVDYQRSQMTANPVKRTDGNENVSMAASARQRMLEREGGKE